MGSGFANLGHVEACVEDTQGSSLGVRSCWTSQGSYVELTIHREGWDRLQLIQLCKEDARELMNLLGKATACDERSTPNEMQTT